MNKRPKEYRQQIYAYIEGLLERPLTLEEHDDLRDMMTEYVFSVQNLSAMVQRFFCIHDWTSDRVGMVEGGTRSRVHVKCRKCDKRSQRQMPTISMHV